eukprot:scaffold101434_cov57-Phaeocystis_antarctica.AAC.5
MRKARQRIVTRHHLRLRHLLLHARHARHARHAHRHLATRRARRCLAARLLALLRRPLCGLARGILPRRRPSWG